MKQFSFLIFLTLLFSFNPAFADDTVQGGTNNTASGASKTNVRAKKTVGHFGSTDPKDVKILTGKCTFFPTPKNPFEGPCVGITLNLVDEATGKIYLVTRVDENGSFGFGITGSGKYRVESSSHFYEMAGMATGLHGGDTIQIKVKQK